MNKKGFTLVELLGVIVILAIILTIAVPSISNIIKNAQKTAFESDAKMIIKAIEMKKLMDDTYDVTRVDTSGVVSELNLSNDNYRLVTTSVVDGKPNVLIEGKGKWAGFTANGSFSSMTVADTPKTYLSSIVVRTGMSPVIISPVYSKITYTYTASVASTVANVTVTPTSEDSAATIRINGVVTTSGQPSTAINMITGVNTISVVVSITGSPTITYTITVTKS